MPVLIGIIICVIFMYLRELDRVKLKKMKDVSETNFLELKYKLENKNKQNKVHFYVARDKDGELWLYLNKPIRCNEDIWAPCKQGCSLCIGEVFKNIGLNEADYKDLKWEDEPVEVFLNLEE